MGMLLSGLNNLLSHFNSEYELFVFIYFQLHVGDIVHMLEG